jgi:2-keto-4-pentenoate hydratase/2-oxohepta-3-ene-1,7-dioic acid hydratase in catechol pathway
MAQEIAYVSSICTLQPGDVLLTGAAKGVSEVDVGSRMTATLSLPGGQVVDTLTCDVVERQGGYQYGRHWTEWLE